MIAAQLQHTAFVQSKWQAVEGELNHFAAIKSQTVILKLIYVSLTICILTPGPHFKKSFNWFVKF